MSRRCPMTSQRSGCVLGRFLAHFEPIIVGFKAQTRGGEGGHFWEVWKGGNTLGHGSLWGRRWIEKDED